MPLRFGQCTLDVESRRLVCTGEPRDLSPKAFQFLSVLLAARPRVVSKQELHDALWPGAFVSESSLPRLAAEVRSAIDDDAKSPLLLRTVHRIGYAFQGPVAETEPVSACSCRVVWGERQIPLEPGENVLGRSPEARVQLDLGRVSRRHARIVVADGKAVLEDLGSKNGTFVRGSLVTRPAPLQDGDEICIGTTVLVFRDRSSNSTTEGAP